MVCRNPSGHETPAKRKTSFPDWRKPGRPPDTKPGLDARRCRFRQTHERQSSEIPSTEIRAAPRPGDSSPRNERQFPVRCDRNRAPGQGNGQQGKQIAQSERYTCPASGWRTGGPRTCPDGYAAIDGQTVITVASADFGRRHAGDGLLHYANPSAESTSKTRDYQNQVDLTTVESVFLACAAQKKTRPGRLNLNGLSLIQLGRLVSVLRPTPAFLEAKELCPL